MAFAFCAILGRIIIITLFLGVAAISGSAFASVGAVIHSSDSNMALWNLDKKEADAYMVVPCGINGC